MLTGVDEGEGSPHTLYYMLWTEPPVPLQTEQSLIQVLICNREGPSSWEASLVVQVPSLQSEAPTAVGAHGMTFNGTPEDALRRASADLRRRLSAKTKVPKSFQERFDWCLRQAFEALAFRSNQNQSAAD